MKKLALSLIIVGALNWLLVGVLEWDLVSAIFGGEYYRESSILSRIIYGLVGLAGVYYTSVLLIERSRTRSTD